MFFQKVIRLIVGKDGWMGCTDLKVCKTQRTACWSEKCSSWNNYLSYFANQKNLPTTVLLCHCKLGESIWKFSNTSYWLIALLVCRFLLKPFYVLIPSCDSRQQTAIPLANLVDKFFCSAAVMEDAAATRFLQNYTLLVPKCLLTKVGYRNVECYYVHTLDPWYHVMSGGGTEYKLIVHVRLMVLPTLT